MAKVKKEIIKDTTGKGYTIKTTITDKKYPLKENPKVKEYSPSESWTPDTSATPVERSVEYIEHVPDRSSFYVNREKTPKKSVKLFVAIRLVRKCAKYHGVMRFSDLSILAQKVLDKYKELLKAANGVKIESITTHPDIRSYIETLVSSFNDNNKVISDEIVTGGTTPASHPASPEATVTNEKPAEYNTKVKLTENLNKEYWIKTADKSTWEAGTEVEGWDDTTKSKKNIKKLEFASVYSENVEVASVTYHIKPSDKAAFDANTEVLAWTGTADNMKKITKEA